MTIKQKYTEMRDYYVKAAEKTSGESHDLCVDAIARIDRLLSIMSGFIANGEYVGGNAC